MSLPAGNAQGQPLAGAGGASEQGNPPDASTPVPSQPSAPPPQDTNAMPSPQTDTGSTGGPSADAGDPSETNDSGPDPGAAGSDDIFGQRVPRTDSFWAHGGRIYRGDEEVRLFGVNWFGLETDALALFGPGEAGRTVAVFLTQVRQLGFNALRIPLAPQSIRPGSPSAEWAVRDGLTTGEAHARELFQAAAEAGIYMLLDVHTCLNTVGYMAGAPADARCGGYTEGDWIADLEQLATIADEFAPWVVGIDLFNEPYELTWSAWRAFAERGGEAVLRANPRILVFVEGVGAEGYNGQHGPFWGENLSAAQSDPVRLPATRLVYSPHVYGPSVYEQPYFADGTFPGNMPAIWDGHFGALLDGEHTLVVGEFGGRYEGADQVWQDAFVDYMIDRGMRSFFYWSLNPNSGDTGGVLLDDWRQPNRGKVELLTRLMQ